MHRTHLYESVLLLVSSTKHTLSYKNLFLILKNNLHILNDTGHRFSQYGEGYISLSYQFCIKHNLPLRVPSYRDTIIHHISSQNARRVSRTHYVFLYQDEDTPIFIPNQ